MGERRHIDALTNCLTLSVWLLIQGYGHIMCVEIRGFPNPGKGRSPFVNPVTFQTWLQNRTRPSWPKLVYKTILPDLNFTMVVESQLAFTDLSLNETF